MLMHSQKVSDGVGIKVDLVTQVTAVILAAHACQGIMNLVLMSRLALWAWYILRPVARIFRREVTWVSDVHVYMHKHARLGGFGGMLPQASF